MIMKITEMRAKDGKMNVRIFVSPMMLNKNCDDFRQHLGWWWCVVGGEVGYFSLQRPRSGMQLRGKFEDYELDIFNANYRINTKEQFAELLSM